MLSYRIIKYKKIRKKEMANVRRTLGDSFSRRVELWTAGYVVVGKWVSAIILIIHANFPHV